MSTKPLEQAIETTRGVLAKVQPDQMGQPTTCASWKVSDLINHVVGMHFFFASTARGEERSSDAPPDFSAGDFAATFDQGAAASVEAFTADGAMERTMHLPFGDMPGSAFVAIAATDTFMHGWDLAKATGQPSDLAPDLASSLLAGIRPMISDGFRGPDGKAPFGPEQQAPAGSSNADKLAAFLGRTV